jgi:hypothetical protein
MRFVGKPHIGALALAAAAATVAFPRDARAEPPEIRGFGGASWSDIVREIQSDPATEGRDYPIIVRALDRVVPCGEYTLSLDAVSAEAFRVGACDTSTSATALRVVRRAALFSPGELVPVPRRASIHAEIVQRGDAEGGGGAPQAGSKIWCSVALQPYLWDGLRGVAVPLSPDRFVLRPIEQHIHAAPDGAGWIARGESRMGLQFHYEVLDIATSRKVLENEATLECSDRAVGTVASDHSWTGVTPAEGGVSRVFGIGPLLHWDFPITNLGMAYDPRAKSTYFGIYPVSIGVLAGNIYFPARLYIGASTKGDMMLSAMTGLGVVAPFSRSFDMHAAPVIRGILSTNDASSGASFGVTFGMNYRWIYDKKFDDGGFALALDVTAPLAGEGVWMGTVGLGMYFGPKWPSKKRR